MATLTYVYSDSTAVLGPLATFAEPHCYDLCALHAGRLTVPRGWEVLRMAVSNIPPAPGPDDLLALADAVREAAKHGQDTDPGAGPLAQRETKTALEPPPGTPATRRGHLRILRD